MNIAKIKLVEKGRRGIEVEYQRIENRGGFDYNANYSVQHQAPVSKELSVLVQSMKDHLMRICRMDLKKAGEDLVITSITSNGVSNFLISAKCTTVGDATFAVNTPMIKDEMGYELFDKAIECIQKIYDEVEAYVEKRKVATPQQIVLDFAQDDPNFNKEEFEGKTEEEQFEVARQMLESKGCVVIAPSDLMNEGDPDHRQESSDEFGEGNGKVLPLHSKNEEPAAKVN